MSSSKGGSTAQTSVWQGKGRGMNLFDLSSLSQSALLLPNPTRIRGKEISVGAIYRRQFPRVQCRAEKGRGRLFGGKLKKISSFRDYKVSIYNGLISVNWVVYISFNKKTCFPLWHNFLHFLNRLLSETYYHLNLLFFHCCIF